MQELFRVYFNRRFLMFFCLLLLLNVAFCVYQCNDAKEITLTGDALNQYIEEYPEFLLETSQNALRMKTLSFFQEKDSFVRRNIEKTEQDYQRMEQVQPVYGENRGIVTYLRFGFTNLLFLVHLVYLILVFTEEKRNGFHFLVRSLAKGRSFLTQRRLWLFVAGLICGAFLLYGSTILTVSFLYPGADIKRAIQSVPEFLKCTKEITVAEFFLQSIGYKVFAGVLVGLFLYLLCSVLNSTVAILLFFGFLLVEYLLYIVLLPTSALNGWKYLNVVAMLLNNDGFTQYCNLNLCGYPVGILAGQILIGLPILFLLLAACFIGNSMTMPTGSAGMQRILDKMADFISRRKPQLPGFLWEWKKVLISQKGVFVLAVILYMAISASSESVYYDMRNPYELHWYVDYEGPLIRERYEEMQAKLAKYEYKLEKYRITLSKYEERLSLERAEGTAPPELLKEIEKYKSAIYEAEHEIVGLSAVIENAASGVEYMERTGTELWLLEPYTYRLLLRDDEKTYQRNQLYCLLAIILTFSGIMSVEYAAHMETELATLYRGRKRTMARKVTLVVLCSAGIAVMLHMIQFVQIGRHFPYHATYLPVQSIDFLREFPLAISIRTYLFLLYCWRGISMALVGGAVMAISRWTKQRIVCIAVCTILFVVPMILLSFWG